jgi:hypothetical protein
VTSRKAGAGITTAAIAMLSMAWPAVVSAFDVSPSAREAGAPARVIEGSGPARAADFGGESHSDDGRRVADWVVVSNDNQGLPFLIVDKPGAKVFLFDRNGRLKGATLALLGRAKGDGTVSGVGSRRLAAIRPEERTTPAGRFVATLGRDFDHDVLWIDYDAAISLHRVVHGDPNDRRLQRLATPSPRDKRISYGCINVPAKFYDEVVLPVATDSDIVVYILPEVKTIGEVFGISDVDLNHSR